MTTGRGLSTGMELFVSRTRNEEAMTPVEGKDAAARIRGNLRRALSHSPEPPAMSPITPANGSVALGEKPPDPNSICPEATKKAEKDQIAMAETLPQSANTSTPKRETSPKPVENATAANQQPYMAQNQMAMGFGPRDDVHAPLYAPQERGSFCEALLALAHLHSQQPPMQVGAGLSSVTPSQVFSGLQNGADDAGNPHHPPPAPTAEALECFAKIEFSDGAFTMTTYSVVIGRDQGPVRKWRREAREKERWKQQCQECVHQGRPPPPQPTERRAKSWYSEEGGMLGPPSDEAEEDGNGRGPKRRKLGSGSGGLGPYVQAPDQEVEDGEGANWPMGSNRQYVSHTPGAVPVDLASNRGDPNHIPFIGIHSPGDNLAQIASRTKGISRKHLTIEWNHEQRVFQARGLHKNGFFHQDDWYNDVDEPVVLSSGDKLQIKDVQFIFVIPEAEPGLAGNDGVGDIGSRRFSQNGKEMSFDFESPHDADMRTTSEDEAEDAMADGHASESGRCDVAAAKDGKGPEPEAEDRDTAQVEKEGEDGDAVMETIERDTPAEETTKPWPESDQQISLRSLAPKKRGPGRPPKNGIMSKREERLMKKQAQEELKTKLAQLHDAEPPIKRKVGRPRKQVVPEEGERATKRNYKPRKREGEEDGTGWDGEKAAEKKRREKPKTPPLELNRADYTDEQLAKPNKNYGVLIDEVLTAAGGDGLSLKQIYKRIQSKYPHYYFHVESKGWESSVRHNLIGNQAFEKKEETHRWKRVPGIDLDAGRKRKASSPDGHGHNRFTPNTAHNGQYMGGYNSTPGNPQLQIGQQILRPAYAQPQSQPRQYGPQQLRVGPVGSTCPPGPHQACSVQMSRPANEAAMAGPPRMAPRRPAPPPQLEPAVAPQLVQFVVNSTKTISEQIGKLVVKRAFSPDAFALSVVNQALGLTTQSMAEVLIPENTNDREEELRKAAKLHETCRHAFEKSRDRDTSLAAEHKRMHPQLLSDLVKAKEEWIDKLGDKVGRLRIEGLLLSAMDRVLAFSDKSCMVGVDGAGTEYEKAEQMLLAPIKRTVEDFQKAQAALARLDPAPGLAPAPAPAPMAPLSCSGPPAAQRHVMDALPQAQTGTRRNGSASPPAPPQSTSHSYRFAAAQGLYGDAMAKREAFLRHSSSAPALDGPGLAIDTAQSVVPPAPTVLTPATATCPQAPSSAAMQPASAAAPKPKTEAPVLAPAGSTQQEVHRLASAEHLNPNAAAPGQEPGFSPVPPSAAQPTAATSTS